MAGFDTGTVSRAASYDCGAITTHNNADDRWPLSKGSADVALQMMNLGESNWPRPKPGPNPTV